MRTFTVHLQRDHDPAVEEMPLEAQSLAEASKMATQFAGEVLRDYPQELWDCGFWRVVVRDEAGAVLCAIEIVGSTPTVH